MLSIGNNQILELLISETSFWTYSIQTMVITEYSEILSPYRLEILK